MKRIIISVSTLLLAVFIANPLFALSNPAAVYCDKLGYEYKVVKTPEGEKGVCVIAEGIEFNAWDFYRGKVGTEYSYCAKYGYDTENERKNQGDYFTECAICVKASKGGEAEERISMFELMKKNGEPLFNLESKDADINKGDPDCKECRKQKEEYNTFPNVTGGENKQGNPPKNITYPKNTLLPSSFDLRNHNGHSYIGAIRDQEISGSCYAFAATATAEGTYNYATGNYDGNRAEFSESFIMWCLGSLNAYFSHFYGIYGADYDFMELEALTTVGICPLADFPYTMDPPGSCDHFDDISAKFSSWGRIPCDDITTMKMAIMTYGVIDANVDSYYDPNIDSNFWAYTDGIYSDTYTNCMSTPCYYTPTDHSVALIGWDNNPPEGGGGCWILRNSAGTDWGEDGYMRIGFDSARITCQAAYLAYDETPLPPSPAKTFSPSEWFVSTEWNVDNSKYVVGGDYDGDGDADIAVMYDYGNYEMGIWVFTANDDDTFSASAWYTTPSWNVDNTRFLVSGDYNGDGKDDLAAMYNYGGLEMGIWVFAADNNTFSPSLWYSTSSWDADNTKFMVSGDFTGDGKDDLATMYDYSETEMGIRVWYSDNNTFEPSAWYTSTAWKADKTRFMVSGNFFGDGRDDLAMIYDYTTYGYRHIVINKEMGVWVFVARENNTFDPQLYYSTTQWDLNNTKFVTSGDYDGDGKDGIAAMYDYGENEMGIWVFAADNNTLSPSLWYSTPYWNINNTKFMTTGDFDGDGNTDIGGMYDYGNKTMSLWSFITSGL